LCFVLFIELIKVDFFSFGKQQYSTIFKKRKWKKRFFGKKCFRHAAAVPDRSPEKFLQMRTLWSSTAGGYAIPNDLSGERRQGIRPGPVPGFLKKCKYFQIFFS